MVLLVVTITTFTSRADVRLPLIFSSNMVLQKGIENTIWGWAAKNENISISLNGKTVKTKACKAGKWSSKLPVMDYGGPYALIVKGNNLIELTNVMIGEVWICSGQSNMEFPVSVAENAKEEIANANYPDIRLFIVPKKVAQLPVEDLENGEWTVCTSKTVTGFSAVGYFFARELYQKLKISIGVIQSAWGGIVAETWISPQTIEHDPDFADKLIQYQRQFPSLITDWRNHWQLGDFPFIWVQLANFMKPADKPGKSDWVALREAQTMALKLPNTGMASAIDIGDANDIHPRNKQEVGRRLGLNALKITYGKGLVAIGPFYQSLKIEGNKVIVSFSNTGSWLSIKNKYGYINGFSVAGTDQKFYWAKATLMNDNTIVVYSEDVQSPVAVRYGWADNPDDLNLYNNEGLPVNQFRTDNWQTTK